VPAGFDNTMWNEVRWVTGEKAEMARFADIHRRDAAEDHDGAIVGFFASSWRLGKAGEDFPGLQFHKLREQHGVGAG